MSAVAALREPVGVLEPGGEVSCEVSVLNTGTIVDQFEIDVLGAPAAWAIVEPPVLSLFPNTQQVATIRFRPPLSHSVAPGPTPFAVRVRPTNAPDFHVTEEGTVILAPFKDVSAELIPQRCEGRYRGKMHIAVDSRGNFPFSVAVLASDPAGALMFRPTPGIIELRPNQAAFAKLRIVPRQHHIRGGMKQQRFTVVLDDNGTPLATLTGTYNQPPVIAKWLLALLIIIAALLIWLLLLRPAIKNTATASAAAAVNGQKAAAAAAAAQAHAAEKAAQQATKNATALQKQEKKVAAGLKSEIKSLNAANAAAKAATSKVAVIIQKAQAEINQITSTTAAPTIAPLAKSIENIAAPGTLSTVKFTIPAGDSFQLTDFVLSSVASSIGSSSSGFTQNGQVRIQEISGNSTINLVAVSLSQLNSVPAMTAKLTTPIDFSAGQSLALNVSCQANQPACDVDMLIDGEFTKPTTTTVGVVKATAPGAPTAAKATAIGSNKVTVSWTPPTSNGNKTIEGYDVYDSTTSGGENYLQNAACTQNGATSTTCTVGSLIKGATYFFTVEAVNSIGNSPPSNEASAKVK